MCIKNGVKLKKRVSMIFDGLFIRLGHAIESIGAKRVVLDTIENLFSGLNNQIIIRAELL